MGANTTYYASVPCPRQRHWVAISAVTANEAMGEAHVEYGECLEVLHCNEYEQLKAMGELAHD